MNQDLMNAIGIKVRQKRSGGGGHHSQHEVSIYKNNKKKNRYSISIRPDIARKLGEYVVVSDPWRDRIIFFPSTENDPDARSIAFKTASKGTRKVVTLTAKEEEDFEQFCGNYDLKWWPDIEGYYISTSSPFREIKEASA